MYELLQVSGEVTDCLSISEAVDHCDLMQSSCTTTFHQVQSSGHQRI